MKKSTRNLLTTMLGIAFAMADVFFYIATRAGWVQYDMGITEVLVIALLAYLLIQAYNETLQNIAKRMLGIKTKGGNDVG